MFKLDKQNKNPKYEQLTEKIKVQILSNMISPNTVQRSYYELENQGYLYSIKGKGYYVASINIFQIGQKIEHELKPQHDTVS